MVLSEHKTHLEFLQSRKVKVMESGEDVTDRAIIDVKRWIAQQESAISYMRDLEAGQVFR